MRLIILVSIIVGALLVYLRINYNFSDKSSIKKYVESQGVTRIELNDKTLVFTGSSNETAMIFFPGGKVEYNAYESLMAACAKRGIMSFLIKMPLDLLPTNAPNRIIKQYPSIKNWYIGGHSFG